MPLNRTNNTVFGTVIQYATTGQIDPLQRWYGLNNHSLTINQYGWINGTGTFGVSTGGVTPQFDVNGAFTTGYIAALAELTAGTLKIGTSSNTENYIAFRGTTGDLPGNFEHGFIGERLYGGTESSELLLFKGNDIEGISGPDRIRLLAANHVFDTYTVALSGSFSTVGGTTSNVYTRMIIKQNGNIGIGTTSPDTIGSSSVPAMLGIVSNAVGTVGLVVKGIASQTASLQQWQNSSGTILAQFSGGGDFAMSSATRAFFGGSSANAYLNVSTAGNPARQGIIVSGGSSQTGNLQEWQNSSGTILASVAPDGTSMLGAIYTTPGPHKIYGSLENWGNPSGVANTSILAYSYSGNANLTIGVNNTDNANNRNWKLTTGGGGYAGQSGAYIGEGGLIFFENNPNDSSSVFRGGFRRGGEFTFGSENTYSASLSITPLSTSTKGQVIRAVSSQTANLQEWQNSSGTTLTSITANGVLAIGNFELNSTFGATFYNKQAAFYDTSNAATYVSAISFARGNTGGAWMALGTTGDTLNGVASVDIRNGNNAQLFSIGYTANAKINLQSASSVGLIIKGAASQTANLQEWQDSSGTALSRINSNGALIIDTANATSSGLVVKGVTGQTANVVEFWQTPASLGLRIQEGLYPVYINNLSVGSNVYSNYQIVGGAIQGNMGNVLHQFSSWNTSWATVGVKGVASQTGDLQQWQNSAGTVLAKITAAGAIDVTAITVNGSPISTSSIPAAADVELMSIMGAY